jgi:hypothetical protein
MQPRVSRPSREREPAGRPGAPLRRGSALCAWALLATLTPIAVASPTAAQTAPQCDSSTALTLVGVDTKARTALFSLAGTRGAPPWLVELDLVKVTATARPDTATGDRFGGSTGPGPVIAARRCGDRCLQPVAYRSGRWEALGEPLLTSPTMTFHATWDRSGSAWVVLHALAGESGVAAKAYRLDRGDWRNEGGLSVRGVGSPGIYPAPASEAGIVTGDGRFAAGVPPQRWLEALPAVAGAQPGELVWLGGGEAAHLGADGALRWTTDAGRRWEELSWQPWSGGEGDLAWKRGRDWWIELPEGERGAPFAAVWNDQRLPTRAKLFLARREGGTWKPMLAAQHGMLTEDGERLPYSHLFRVAGERWVLMTGCVSRKEGAALALRVFADGTLQPPTVVKVTAAGSVSPAAAAPTPARPTGD